MTENFNRGKILQKLASLIAKAESTTNPEERDAFLKGVDRLLTRYQLELSDVQTAVESRSQKSTTLGQTSFLIADYREIRDWKILLGSVLGEWLNCRVLTGYSGTMLIVIGTELDRTLFEQLYSSITNQLESMYDRDLTTARSRNLIGIGSGKTHIRTFRKNYLVMAVVQLQSRIRQIIRMRAREHTLTSDQSTALVVLKKEKDAELQKFVDQTFETVRSSAPVTLETSSMTAYLMGTEAGNKVQLSSGLTSADSSPSLHSGE